ncbi:MAG: dual specificity protein phosphatase family protein [Akkermansiaceae bacterium]|nr:dual specificity protein phosphatase family protein [Akkermansiaceae bacterium]
MLTIFTCCLLILPVNGLQARPESWAQPVKLDGVPNLHKINANIYRSAQPSAQGMQNLKQKGVATIINLRTFHSDRDEIGNSGLGYEHIFMKAWHPEREDVIRFLEIATDPKRTPVLVHCQHGADRTGALCAVYRMAVQGWTKEEAIQEMVKGGYGFHGVWENLQQWIESLDIATMRKEAGIKKPRKISEKSLIPRG